MLSDTKYDIIHDKVKTLFKNLLLALVAVAGMDATADDEFLRTLAEVRVFEESTNPRRVPFELTGSVHGVYRVPRATEVILADGNGLRAELFISDPAVPPPAAGDTIRATGIARLGENHEQYLRLDEFTVLAHDTPPAPTDVRLPEIDGEKLHLATIRTEGVVIDDFPDEIDHRYDILLLKDGDIVIPVSLPHEIFSNRTELVDARIRVTGVYHRYVGGVRKFGWPNLSLHAADELEILVPPPEDPFAVPPLEHRLYLSAEAIARMTKRAVRGEVLATWRGDRAMVREAGGRVVNLTLANGVALPAVGATIVAVGQPETDLYRINLGAARWKDDAAEPPRTPDETARTISSVAFWRDRERTSINAEAHGQLISARGVVRTLPSPDDADRRFVLDADGLSLTVDATGDPDVLDGLEIGCRIEVTGRCLVLTDEGRRDFSASRIRGFALVVRSSDDITVLSRPPWWTPARLLVLVAFLFAALVGFAVWNLVQRHFARLKIAERTRLAVEIHDTLSQNLAGVACQVSAGNFALDENPEAAKPYITAAENMLQSCRTELRNCLFDLRSDMLEEPDFERAIYKALNQLTYETAVAVRFPVRRADFTDPFVHAVLSVIRELTANAVRHGRASAVRIAGCTDAGKLLFSVTDNGRGFDPEHCAGIPEGHFGLSGIRDRLKRLGGDLTITSTPDKGAKATVTLPIPKS